MERKGNCESCSLRDCKFVPWQYPSIRQHPIMLVGQAPGGTEAITKVPFTGPAGKMLWRIMKEAGLDKQHTVVTNIVTCAPPEDRAPTLQEMRCCKQHLEDEILITKPELIVALGEIAANALTGRSGIQSLRGQMFPLLSSWNHECPVLCMLHPSFVMRQRQWIEIATNDMRRIVQHFDPTVVVKEKIEPTFMIDPSIDELAHQLGKMSVSITAVDIETPAELDILTAKIIGIAFCASPELAIGLNLTEEDKGTEKWRIIKRFLEDPTAKKCTQNGSFDTGVLKSNGINVKGLVFDTLYAEHTMNSDLPGKLDSLRGRYTDIAPYKPSAKEIRNIAGWTSEKRSWMNCWDVVTTLAVMYRQKELMTPEQTRVLEDIELPLIEVCDYMERKGIKVDVIKLALLHKKLAPAIEAINAVHFRPLGLNPNSPVQLMKYLNVSSTAEDDLEHHIKRGHPKADMMRALLDYRGMHKSVSVYLVGVYERLRDGRIHAHPDITGTGTGRLSYKNPNLQNVPEDLRLIYIPDDEDHVFINGDYNQLELRVGAIIAPEPAMLQEFAEGKNVHHSIGREIYGREWDDLSAAEKLEAKTVVFGTFYGRSARSIAMEFGVSIAKAEVWQDLCIRRYPGLLNYIRNQSRVFSESHKCTTPFGRVRHLQTITQAFNTPIQSSASDVTLTTLIALLHQGFDIRVTVHDSILVQAPRRHMKEVASAMRAVMERPIEPLKNYSFPVKLKAGKNWREVEEI